MRSDLRDNFLAIVQRVFPILTLMLLLLVALIPLPMPSYSFAFPNLALIGIYFFAIHRSDAVGAFTVLMMGLVLDAPTGGPLGLNGLLYLWMHWFVVGRRRWFVGRSFALLWLWFAGLMVASPLLNTLIWRVMMKTDLPWLVVAGQYLTTVLVYPLVVFLLSQVDRSHDEVER